MQSDSRPHLDRVVRCLCGRTYWGAERSTFVLGADGVVQEVLRKVKPGEHDDLVLARLATM
jgi:peroxiredoxin Q/BCP